MSENENCHVRSSKIYKLSENILGRDFDNADTYIC